MLQRTDETRTWRSSKRPVILADHQAIFRAGAARVLASEQDMEIIAQCADFPQLMEAVQTFSGALVMFPARLASDLVALLQAIDHAGSKPIAVLDHGEELDETVSWRIAGVVHRSVTGAQLVDCLRTVASGERSIQRAIVKSMPSPDRTGDRVLQRLTPKEMQIVALVGEGCKNKEIASRLGTKEQVIKNYLRTIYDKTGVSDRLELALFTLHHRALAEAAEQVRASFARSA